MKKILTILTVILIEFAWICPAQQEIASSYERLINIKTAGETDKSIRVALEVTGDVKYHVFKVTNPERLVIEMVDVVYDMRVKEQDVDNNLLKRIRAGQYKDKPVKIVRVVLDMATAEYYFEEVTTKNEITISIGLTKKGLEDVGVKTAAAKETVKKHETMKKPEKKPVKKVKSYVKKPAGNIAPNIPDAEHRNRIAEILAEKRKRDKEKRKREAVLRGEEVYEEPVVQEAEEKEYLEGYLSFSQEPVNFNFKDADILEVLQSFAIKLDINIVPESSVRGKVTFKLQNVPFDEAFKMLMDRMDLVAIKKSANVIEVLGKASTPTDRRTFLLKSRTAEEINTTLTGLLTTDELKDTKIATDDASNSLIITATPEVLNKIDLIVRQLDIKKPQIKIQARILEVAMSEDASTGMTWWNSYRNPDPLADGMQGVDIVKDAGNITVDSAGNATATVFSQGGLASFSAVMDDITLRGWLNFLASNSKTKTLSEPVILTENNKQAKIHVGQNLPVVTTTIVDNQVVQTVEFIPEGVDLAVTPIVSPGSDNISVKIELSVSEFVSFINNNPVTADRSAETEITVKSGRTVVIGGLIREKVVESDSGIPLLKDIPIIGYLFTNRSDTKSRSELLVFLTPEIIIE